MKVYHSRFSRPGQIRSFPLGHPLCAAMLDLSPGARTALRDRVIAGGEVMLDSGAFGLAKRGIPLELDDAEWVTRQYEELVEEAPDKTRVMVVAPDVIGDAEATCRLQAVLLWRYAVLERRGATVVVPVQGVCAKDAARAFVAARAIVPGCVPGIPCVRSAWSDRQIAEFAELTAVLRLHFLGGASQKMAELALDLGVEATADSGYAVIRGLCLGRDGEERAQRRDAAALAKRSDAFAATSEPPVVRCPRCKCDVIKCAGCGQKVTEISLGQMVGPSTRSFGAMRHVQPYHKEGNCERSRPLPLLDQA